MIESRLGESLRDLWEHWRTSIHVIRVKKERRKKVGAREVLVKMIAENLQNLARHTYSKSWRKTNRINSKIFTPRHMIIQLLKLKTKEKSWNKSEKRGTLPIVGKKSIKGP
jgi:tRNA nucleotidyltransferase/poly(A) polymerase